MLFLGVRNSDDHTGIRTVELDGLDDLSAYQHTHFSPDGLKDMDHSKEKWTQYFLDQDEIDLLRTARADNRLTTASNVMAVDVGIVI